MRLPNYLKFLLLSIVALTLGACTTGSSQDGWYYKGYYQGHPHTGSNELSSAGKTCFFCKKDPAKDEDGDGVADSKDKCPATPKGVKVGPTGCPSDSDGDGIADNMDSCPDTSANVTVDTHGCPLDSDGDGVDDSMDTCPDTSASVEVDSLGCPLDSDYDGVIDSLDQCPGTKENAEVNKKGCPLDSDGDMVSDDVDKCLGTPANVNVNSNGCWEVKNLNFRSGRSKINSSSYPALNAVANTFMANPNLKAEVQGYTDSRGSNRINTRISKARAQSVVNYLIGKGVSSNRLVTKGYGPKNPIADNSTREGRSKNRRVEIKPIQ
ncbi:MAG: OmpA family protein [Magnetococcales bacterium]|nr:OmpA family protein [Magnetococcales bacterium]